jgi:hypothetical protein
MEKVEFIRFYLTGSISLFHLIAKVDDSDDELAVADSDMLTLDPITKQTMTDPVRIKQCGHTFERSSIVSLLKNKRHIR